MTKKMRELQNKMQAKAAEAEGLTKGDNVTTEDIQTANALMDEVDAMQKEFETLERIEKARKAGVPAEDPAEQQKGAKGEDVVKAFISALRDRFKDMNEGSKVDGGYTVPEDIRTQVQKYKEEHFSLATLIDYEHVTTLSGRRTYQKRAQHTGFSQVAEGGKVTKMAAPQFEILEYLIKKLGGFLPVTNELLADSDANILGILVEWLGEEEIATENAQVLAAVNKKDATALTGMKDIKKAINVTLAAFTGTVRIVTNSDGLNYLDTLEDKNGRPLLSPDPTNPMALSLSVGVRRIPVTVVPNHILATAEGGKIPFIMGDLKEYMKEFDRQQVTLATSNVAAVGDLNAYEQDLTLIRALMRADWVVKDSAAIVRGELTATAAA